MAAIGIKQYLICHPGTLRNDPDTILVMGMGDEASFERTEVPQKGMNDEDYEGKWNHKHSFKSFQFSAQRLQNAIDLCIAGACDLQAVGQKRGANVWTGIYDYTGDNPLGFGFEMQQNSKDRFFLFTAEAQFEAWADLQIMQSAGIILPIDLNDLGLGHLGINPAEYAAPSFSTLFNPATTAVCNGYEIIDRKYAIKSVAVKKEFNRDQVNWINFNFQITIDKTDASDVVEYLSNDRGATLKITENGPGGVPFTFDFDSNLFWRVTESIQKKTEGNIILKFNRNISLGDIAIDTETNILSVSNHV